MRTKIISILKKLKFQYTIYYVKNIWRKRHAKIFNHEKFNLCKLTPEEKKDYSKYWNVFGIKVSFSTVEISKSLAGTYNRLIVPEELFILKLEPNLNIREEVLFFGNKNFYNKWFGDDFPLDYIHRINGKYYTREFNIIDDIIDYIDNNKFKFPLVFKPSINTSGGLDVSFINTNEELINIISSYSNFVVQEKINQHPFMDNIYNSSVNSVRVCLLRRPKNGEIVVLNSCLRMGKDGANVDNESTGGIACSINSEGILNDYAADKYAEKYFIHPNSKFIFKDKVIPDYENLKAKSIEVSMKILTANLISLDMCLDEKGKWRCIEANVWGQTLRSAQYAGVPFFGKYTDEVIDFIKKNTSGDF